MAPDDVPRLKRDAAGVALRDGSAFVFLDTIPLDGREPLPVLDTLRDFAEVFYLGRVVV